MKLMENKQQTAVDWFFTQILGSLHSTMSKKDIDELLQKAKEIENTNLNNARIDGINLANKGYGKK